jgi:threonine dehydrogenase-like Zn-dependent dehydrogenase
MLACRVYEGEPLVVDDHPEPTLADGLVLIRVTHVAVTMRDIIEVRRHRRGVGGLPDVLGHACIGTVVDPNSAAAFQKDERVAVWPDLVCGSCDMCRGGYRSHCRSKRVLGLKEADGVLAELIAVPSSCCVKLPNDLHDDEAILCFPLASALQAAQALQGSTAGHITVLGATTEAVLAATILSQQHAGARLLSGSASALDACEKLGVPHRDIKAAGRREDQDIIIDCTASARGLATALELVRPGGRVLLIASPPAEPFDIEPIVDREIIIQGCKPASLHPAIEFLLGGGLNVEGLITSRLSMQRAAAAFAKALEPGQLQVVVDVH